MADETEIGPAGAPDSGRHPQGSGGVGSPLQARAAFVKNWDWQSVISINRGACERGRAQHGVNSETGRACAQEWEELRSQILTLGETLDRLRGFHRKAPFLFFNGNTFVAGAAITHLQWQVAKAGGGWRWPIIDGRWPKRQWRMTNN